MTAPPLPMPMPPQAPQMAPAPPQAHAHPHSHGPPGAPGPGPGMQMAAPPPNPELQALLDSIPHQSIPYTKVSVPIPGTNPPQAQDLVVCPVHKQVECETCGVEFKGINYLYQFLRQAPVDAIPPPPNVPAPPQRAEQIKAAKDAGNVAFKAQNFPQAVMHYSRSVDMALSRPPWEPSALGREEAVVALCNRSAAFAYAGNFGGALADAEVVVALKRPWTKGHFRKAKALIGLGRWEEAREALVDGLQFEPTDKELNNLVAEIDSRIQETAA